MGTGDGRDFMPDDRAGVLRACNTWRSKGKALNALGIQMNLAKVFAREALQHFGKRALGTMAAVNER
jgi:hypothetical protein